MKKSFLMATVFLLTGVMVFAQIGMFADPSGNMDVKSRGMEASLGYQLNSSKEKDAALATGSAIALSWRQYFEPISDKIDFGYSIAAAITFMHEREWKIPGDIPPFTFNNKTYNKGDPLHITWAEGTYIMNLSFIAGPAIKGKIAGGFGFAADVGIGFNMDMAKWKSLQASTNENLYLDLVAFNLGINLNGGLQYRLGIGSKQLIFELGVSIGYYFTRFNSADLYWADKYDRDKNKTEIGSVSGAVEAVNIFRLGAPYFVIGWAF